MAPTMDATAPAEVVSDIQSIIASSPGVSEGAPEAPATPAVESAPSVDGTLSGDAPAPDAPTTDGTGYQLSEDGNSYIVPKAEIASIGGLRDYAQKVQTMFPTASDAEVARIQAADYRGLRADFLSGDEGNISQVLSYFAGQHQGNTPEEQRQFKDSFVTMATKMPEVLKSVNPEAYGRFSDGILQSAVDAAYAHAAETGDQTDFLQAQSLDWARTGLYKTELPKHDPVQAEAQRIQQQQADFQKREDAAYNRDFKYFNDTSMDGPKWSAYNSEIAKILAPVKGKYDPAMFKAVESQVSREVIDKLKADFEWSRDHNNERSAISRAYQNAWKNQQSADFLKQRLQAYQTDFMARVRRELPSIAASFLGKATASAVTKPQAQPAAQPPQAAAPRAPNGQFQKPQPADFDIVAEVQRTMRLSQ